MKLLVLSNNVQRASFRQRIGSYIPLLERAGIECQVKQLPKRIVLRHRAFREVDGYDAVLLHKKTLTRLDAWTLRARARVLIYDFDDAIMYSATHPAKRRSSHFGRFRRTTRLMDAVIAGNPYLAEHAERFNENVQVLPTGLDTHAWNEVDTGLDDGRIRLVWIGSKSTLPYLEALQPVLEQLSQRFKNLVLRVICDAFPDFDGIELESCVWSAQTQAADLAVCDIGLAPLPDNRFTRGKCGFKILQYAATGLPTVGSPVGVNADFIDSPQQGLSAVTSEQWMDALAQLIDNPVLRQDMGHRARRFSRQFDALRIGERFVSAIQKVLNPPT
jgi:glycosyltransferase involved in cell wall biosynthesis